VLLLVAILLLANAILGERGLVALARAERDLAGIRAAVDALHLENIRLHHYTRTLSENTRSVEMLARGELGMIRPGEQLFIVKTTTLEEQRPNSPDRAAALPESAR
jgi:cell division protein FtsB